MSMNVSSNYNPASVGGQYFRNGKLERGLYGLSTDKLLTLYERYRIDPTYLITGEKNQTFDVELFLANCDREERNRFIERMLAYMGQLMLQPK